MGNKWISVKDRLPEPLAWILAYGDGAIDCVGFSKRGFEFLTEPRAPGLSLESITHWQPLPDEPGTEPPVTLEDSVDICLLEVLATCSLIDHLGEQVRTDKMKAGRAADLIGLFKKRFLDRDDNA